MDNQPFKEADILEVFKQLGLSTADDRDRFLQLEKLGRIESANDPAGAKLIEVSFGGPSESTLICR